MSKAVKRTTGNAIPDDADNETTRVISSEDVTKTEVIEPEGTTRRVPDEYYARPGAETVERTQVIPETPDADDIARREAEEARRQEAEQRARERAMRQRSLGTVAPPAEPDPTPVEVPRPVTDRAFASMGLFIFRVVLAAVLGVHSFQHLTQRAGTYDMINGVGLPYPTYLVWVLGVGEGLAALGILVGLWTRIAGLGAAAIGVLALVFVHWHGLNVFADAGVLGEPALLVASCGLLLFFIGSGGWGIDAGPRRRRAVRKASRAAR